MNFNDALKKFKEINIGLIILTSVDRDGTLEGFNQNLVSNYLNNSDIPLIISGGIKDENDLKVISELKNKNIFGVILGKSLYENKIDLKKCIQDYENVS
jgi:phosphoribosylformimino-5-aminoimidazole carboxamide ribotide isomerase